jgi:cytidylate kinase
MPTQLRQIRMGDLWEDAREVAAKYDMSTSEFVRIAIAHLIESPERDKIIDRRTIAATA